MNNEKRTLSERAVDFLLNCHSMGTEGRKEYSTNILSMNSYSDVISEICDTFGTESPEEFVYNMTYDIYYNLI